MDHLSLRRRQMFIGENTNCIKEDVSEVDDEDEYSSDINSKSERNGVSFDSNIIECGYGFRKLLSFDENKEPTLDNNYFNSYRPLDNNKEVTQVQTESWQREITDSDVVLENDYSGTDIISSTKDSLFTNQEPFQKIKSYSRSSSSHINSNTGYIDRSFELFNTPHTSAAFPRFHL
mmetsp:Transcript_26031/g.29235  ORF Transcript_26031/g.29235 Transcript_26031/m.29235 type:complete len:176 (-) Transcript_26031:57-584(-)